MNRRNESSRVSQSSWRMPALTAAEDELLAMTPAEELLELDILQRENIRGAIHYHRFHHPNRRRSNLQLLRALEA